MGLLSIFRRRTDAASPPAQAVGETGDAVQRARTRARQRLIGAVVLVGVGIIGFPLVFETQPRPIPVDIPIEIPRTEGAATLPMPPARVPALPAAGAGAGVVVERSAEPAAATPASAASAASAAKLLAAREEIITESRDEAGRERALPAALAKPTASAATATVAKKVAEPKAPATLADGARAKALLEGKQALSAPAGGARFVVQVGAFADASSAHETRLKIEKLGLKTYTQVADTPSGSRIRVRVGPFATRVEADQARARARSAGLGAVVLTL